MFIQSINQHAGVAVGRERSSRYTGAVTGYCGDGSVFLAMSAMVDVTASEDSGGDEQEETHWRDVARTFLAYFDFMLRNLDKRRDRIGKLSIVNFNLLPACTYDKINNIEHACQSNQGMIGTKATLLTAFYSST